MRYRPGLSDQGGAAFGPGARFTIRFPAHFEPSDGPRTADTPGGARPSAPGALAG